MPAEVSENGREHAANSGAGGGGEPPPAPPWRLGRGAAPPVCAVREGRSFERSQTGSEGVAFWRWRGKQEQLRGQMHTSALEELLTKNDTSPAALACGRRWGGARSVRRRQQRRRQRRAAGGARRQGRRARALCHAAFPFPSWTDPWHRRHQRDEHRVGEAVHAVVACAFDLRGEWGRVDIVIKCGRPSRERWERRGARRLVRIPRARH